MTANSPSPSHSPHAPIRPLSGLKVVEYANFISGPYCARLLADAGAEVVKVEPPEGDEARRRGPFPRGKPDPNQSGLFMYLNTNKRGMVLDLHKAKDRDTFLRLLKGSDVLIENMPPSAIHQMELDFTRLHPIHPGLIVTSVTPFGQSGPYRDYKGDDLIALNMGGLAYATPGLPDHIKNPKKEPPLRPATYLSDFAAGLAAAVATFLAIISRERDGLGRHADVSQQETVASMMIWDITHYSYLGTPKPRYPTMQQGLAPNTYIPCKDGHVALVAFSDDHWRKLVEIMGCPGWAGSELFEESPSRAQYWDALGPMIQEWAMAHTGREIYELTQPQGLPCFPAYEVSEAVDSEHVEARGSLTKVEADGITWRMPGPPFRFSNLPCCSTTPAPRLGEHTGPILKSNVAREEPHPARLRQQEPIEALHNTGTNKSALPLKGTRVIDLGVSVAAPFATQWLAYMGAEVVCLESRHRAVSRMWPPFADGVPGPNRAGTFNSLYGSKLSCTLDLSTPQGKELAREIILLSDVVVENLSLGSMDKLGLGYQQLLSSKPDLIILSISAFGRTGPMREFVGYHSAVLMYSGLAAVTGYEGGHPRILGSVFPDPLSGTYAVLAILEALHQRARTGHGQHIDLAMHEAMMTFMPRPIIDYTMNGQTPARVGNEDPAKAPHGVYPCKNEGTWVAISVGTDEEWHALCKATGHEEWYSDSRFADTHSRQSHATELEALIDEWTIGQTPSSAMDILQRVGVAAGPSLDAKGILNDPHLKERGFVVETEHPEAGHRVTVGVPWRISDLPPFDYRAAPLLGQHTEYVLGHLLGMPRNEQERLVEERVAY